MTFLSNDRPLPQAAALVALALIISTTIASYTAFSIKASADIIEVTGSARVAVESDFARLTINLTTHTGTTNQSEGYRRIEAATEKALAHIRSLGLEDIETPSPSIFPVYAYPQGGEPILTSYQIDRQLIIRSSNINAVQSLANSVEPFVGTDYTVTIGSVELTYQNLPQTRVTLLTAAIADAKARAEAIAKETGRNVGDLRTASGGVVQVLPAGGVEVSDYGMYDTGSVSKEVMVTVRAKFSLQ